MSAATAVIVPLDTVQSFPTPEHTSFQFRLAGPMARAMAWVLDLIIRMGLLIAVWMVTLATGLGMGIGLALLLTFVIDWLSGGLCEWLWQGYTPGKRALGIRVVGIDGLPASAGACFLRNLMRWADWLPIGFCLGLVAMFASGSFQRLGDLAAGTLVVYGQQRRPQKLVQLADPKVDDLVARLPPDLPAAIDGRSARALAAYIARRKQFHHSRRNEMAEHLAGPLRRRFGLDARLDADLLLCAVYAMLFQDAAGGSAGRAAALLARRRDDWLALEGLLGGAHPGTAPALRAATAAVTAPRTATAAALDLSRLYRSACADLALADAYHLPGPNVAYLHGLVAKAHLRFYRRIAVPWSRLRDELFVRVPARLYGDGCLRVALLAFFGVFLASGLLGALRPDLAQAFVGDDQLADMRDMYAKAPDHRSDDLAAQMGGFYIFNNVGIALSCFASGIFAGIGSLVWLLFNGLSLGLIFGYMWTVEDPTRAHFFEFVSAHGPFELTGITLSGAAGLRLGLGLVATRGLPRLESLRLAAAQAVPILGVAAALVAMAAPIEAFVSPSSLPLYAKRGLMALCAALLLVYFVVLGWRGRRILAASGRDGVAA